jgi:hypothetical protein
MALVLVAAALWACAPGGLAAHAQDIPAPPPPAPAAGKAAVAFGDAASANASEIPWAAIGWTAGYAFLLLVWASTGDWVNSDSQIFSLGYKKWNPIVYFPFAAAFLGLAFAPIPAWARYLALWVVYLATISVCGGSQ